MPACEIKWSGVGHIKVDQHYSTLPLPLPIDNYVIFILFRVMEKHKETFLTFRTVQRPGIAVMMVGCKT